MKQLSRRGGFSLVELLTVIAIIAVLASIIFPVMGTVKERANQSNCMSNLKQIAVGVQMFKTDNRQYPTTLGSQVHNPDGSLWLSPGGSPAGSPERFESCKDTNSLFAEYVKTIQMFHCRDQVDNNSQDVIIYYAIPGVDTSAQAIYAFDSYDTGILNNAGGKPSGGVTVYPPSAVDLPHYCKTWAMSVSNIYNNPSLVRTHRARQTPPRSLQRTTPGSCSGETRPAIQW